MAAHLAGKLDLDPTEQREVEKGLAGAFVGAQNVDDMLARLRRTLVREEADRG